MWKEGYTEETFEHPFPCWNIHISLDLFLAYCMCLLCGLLIHKVAMLSFLSLEPKVREEESSLLSLVQQKLISNCGKWFVVCVYMYPGASLMANYYWLGPIRTILSYILGENLCKTAQVFQLQDITKLWFIYYSTAHY